MTRKHFMILVILVITLTGCNQTSNATQPPVLTPTPPNLPEAGMATVIGRLVNQKGEHIPRTIIRLAEVVRGAEGEGGAYILDTTHSPGTATGEAGYFIIQNIKATEYVLVIGDVDLTGIYEIIHEDDGMARIFNMPADQITNLGDIVTIIQPPQYLPGSELTPVVPGAADSYPAPITYPAPLTPTPYP